MKNKDMENFEMRVTSGYRNLRKGDFVKLIKITNEDVVFTLNKGRKQFKIKRDLMNFFFITSTNVCNMETIFINPDLSDSLHHTTVKNHTTNMTELGLLIYNSHTDADLFISQISNE